MKYIQPLNEPENSHYTDDDTGFTIPAAAVEHPQRELLAIIEAAGITPNKDDLSQVLQAIRKLCAPAGVVFSWAGRCVPDGFLLCNGQVVSRKMYPDLFATIGTEHGTSSSATSFNLPDLSDKFILGASTTHPAATSGGSFEKSGATDGHQLTIPQMPAHKHFVVARSGEVRADTPYRYGSNSVDWGRVRALSSEGAGQYALLGSPEQTVPNVAPTSQTGGDQEHSHTITDFDVTNPYYSLAYIIRT